MTRRVTASAVRVPNIQTKTTLWVSDITSTLITYQYYNKKPYRSYMSATDFTFHCAAEPTTPTFTKGQPTKERTGLARLSVHTHTHTRASLRHCGQVPDVGYTSKQDAQDASILCFYHARNIKASHLYWRHHRKRTNNLVHTWKIPTPSYVKQHHSRTRTIVCCVSTANTRRQAEYILVHDLRTRTTKTIVTLLQIGLCSQPGKLLCLRTHLWPKWQVTPASKNSMLPCSDANRRVLWDSEESSHAWKGGSAAEAKPFK